MSNDAGRKLILSHRVALCAVVAAVLALPIATGLLSRDPAMAQAIAMAKAQSRGNQSSPADMEGGAARRSEGHFALPDGPISSDEMLERFSQAAETPVEIIRKSGEPVSITGAILRAVEAGFDAAISGDHPAPARGTWVMPRLEVVNNTDRGIELLVVELRSKHLADHYGYMLPIGTRIGPGESYTVNRSLRRRDLIMGVHEEAGDLTVQVIGAIFEDGQTWGVVPVPPPPPPDPPAPPAPRTEARPSVMARPAAQPPAPASPAADVVPPAKPVVPSMAAPAQPAAPRPSTDPRPQPVKPDGDQLAVPIVKVQPEYPAPAKAAGVTGRVTVEVTIDEEGNVISARAIEGHDLLKGASVEAARKWKFKPATSSSKPAKSQGVLNFTFER